MEYGLRETFLRMKELKPLAVLILVLMEYGLRGNDFIIATLKQTLSLSPCFNGIWSARLLMWSFLIVKSRISLNPCFNGIWSASLQLGDCRA